MLRKVGESAWPISEKDAVVSIKDASYPIPFPQGLEFNSPAHGCWNIVHTGMLIPEAHQIYVCADNCMRGVVLTAAEMCEEDRFSFVIVEEQNLLSGNLEDVTIEGTADILRKLKEREEKTGQKMPKAVLLFTVCLHHFLGCDLERIYRELEQRFPEIRFLRCYMDPIMQKHGPTPDQKLRKAMYEPLNPDRNKMDTKQISILGSDFALDLSCDLKELLAIAGYKVRELQDCSTWEEYEELGNAGTFLCCYPSGKYGIETLAERLRRAFLYLPLSFDYEEIRSEEETLWNSLGVEGKQILSEWMEKKIALCEEALNHAKQIIGNAPITIDYTFHPRPLGLARLLLIHGFNVKTVFLDSISPEEKEVFEWLKVNAPKLELRATVHAKMRVLHEAHPSEKTLAIGQKAAWSTGSHYFVNLVQGASLILQAGLGITIFIGTVLITGGKIELLPLLVLLMFSTQIYGPILAILSQLTSLFHLETVTNRMRTLLTTPAMEGEDKDVSKYDIELKNVTFGYNQDDVIKDVSFSIPAGSVTALVGPSGSGKSTISKLIARFWDVRKGQISIGGMDVRTIEPEHLMRCMSFVFQDVTLFNDTVFNNIRVGNMNATEEQVMAAAKAAYCDEFIQRLPDGYQTVLGENGSTLSGGERQRISIARALLKDAPIILLDEATASLDPENEVLIQRAIAKLVEGKTVIMIAHRLRTVVDTDQIIVLDNGKLVEQGTHEELMKKNGLYHKLFHIQQESLGWAV